MTNKICRCSQNDAKKANNGAFLGTLVFEGKSNLKDHDSYTWKPKGKKKPTKVLTEYSCTGKNCNAKKSTIKVDVIRFGINLNGEFNMKYLIHVKLNHCDLDI